MKNTIFWDTTPCSPAHMVRTHCLHLRQTGPDDLLAHNTTIQTSERPVSCPGMLHYAHKYQRLGGAQCILWDGFTLTTKALMTLHYWQSSLMTLHYWQSSLITLQYWQSTPFSHRNSSVPLSPPATTQYQLRTDLPFPLTSNCFPTF
jgi:hypothetical protein